MTNILEVKDLCVEVDGQKLLHGIDLTIPDGEIHALLGPNGCGKTTLMMVVMGYPEYRVIQGQILFNGEDITELDITERARLGIGISQQRPPTIAGVKLQQVLDFIIAQAPKRVDEIDGLVRAVHMERFLDRDVNADLSGGEIKRSELLQLLVTQPRFAMLDEPDSGVDLEACPWWGIWQMHSLPKSLASQSIENRASSSPILVRFWIAFTLTRRTSCSTGR